MYFCGMKHKTGWLIFSLALFVAASCKSEYEVVRTSGDSELILKEAFKYYEAKDYQRALSLFDLVLNALRGDARAEQAYYQYAYCHYNTKQYTLAAFYFKNFANTFTNSPQREETAFMSAYCNYLLSPTHRLDQGNTQSAIDEFQLFVNLFPNSKRVQECNKLIDELRRKLEEKAFAEGELYFNLRQYQSAVISFNNLLREYPESADGERVRYLIAKSSFLLSENSVIEKKVERYNECIARCKEFEEKYPKGEYTKEVKQFRKQADSALKVVKKRLKS